MEKFKKVALSSALSLILAVTGFSIFVSKPVQPAKAGDNKAPEQNQSLSFFQEAKFTEDNQKKLFEAQPPKTVEKSLERENLNRRLEFMNDENRVGYVYLLADTGQVIAEYVIKGKPSSLNSYITQSEQIRCYAPNAYNGNDKGCSAVQSPDLDGSYGDNPDGIFFFTADNNYVEWSGKYVYSSQSLNINTPVSLTRSIN